MLRQLVVASACFTLLLPAVTIAPVLGPDNSGVDLIHSMTDVLNSPYWDWLRKELKSYFPEETPVLGPGKSGMNLITVFNKLHQNWLRKELNTYFSEKNKIPLTLTTKTADLVVTNKARDPAGCTLPSQSQHMLFCELDCFDCQSPSCSIETQTRLAPRRTVKVQCAPGHGFSGQQQFMVVGCSGNKWIPDISQCLKLCPTLESEWVVPQCQLGSTSVNCRGPMVPGTTARYHCRSSHVEYPDLAQAGVYRRTITCRRDGRWSNLLPECKPVCGVSNVTITPTVVNGNATKLGDFPWHASIFHRPKKMDEQIEWVNVCGGSLVSKRLVLTAAHCLPPEPNTISGIRIALGKIYRDWSRPEEIAIKRNVSQYFVPEEYKGSSTTYTWDIALLVLDKEVTVNSFIMPMCLDFDLPQYDPDSIGYVVGFGRTTANGKTSEILMHNDLYLLSEKQCRRLIPRVGLLAVDKLCGSKDASSIAERGDSGGGLTTVHFDGLYYIRGVVSVKFNDKVSLFTNISWNVHQRWITNLLDLV